MPTDKITDPAAEGRQAIRDESCALPLNQRVEELTSYIYNLLDCQEEQTKSIIVTMLGDIQLFDKKQHDYGPGNIAKFGEFGVLVRTNDKLERLINLNRRGDDPANESVMDTWQDLSVYGAIARVVKQNQWKS